MADRAEGVELGLAQSVRWRQTPRGDIQAGFSHAVASSMAATALSIGRKVCFNQAKLEMA